MQLYHHITEGVFLERLNRFAARCLVNGETCVCHVKNTGRCRELLLPNSRVWLEDCGNPARKTRYDLVCVENRGYCVNIDSQAPNKLFGEWAEHGGLTGLTLLRPETTYGDSRFDYYHERLENERLIRGFTEVKGVTLFDDAGMAFFPDAPTERGVKHLHGLMNAAVQGYEAAACFVAQRKDVCGIKPNDAAHPAFGKALRMARAAGVQLRGFCCEVTPDCSRILREIPVITD